jgi:hypothetical protein
LGKEEGKSGLTEAAFATGVHCVQPVPFVGCRLPLSKYPGMHAHVCATVPLFATKSAACAAQHSGLSR